MMVRDKVSVRVRNKFRNGLVGGVDFGLETGLGLCFELGTGLRLVSG